jgi:hypothetical protein
MPTTPQSQLSSQKFPVWKTIPLGLFYDIEGVLDYFVRHNCHLSQLCSRFLLKRIRYVRGKKVRINLVQRTLEQLDLKDDATFEEICTRAQEYGLKLCPGETGPSLRSEYLDQPPNEVLMIAMETVFHDGLPHVFVIKHLVKERFDMLGLYATQANPRSTWPSGTVWVFVVPEEISQ